MRASRMLLQAKRNYADRRLDNQITPVLVRVLNSAGPGGGEFHDTSGFHERDTEYRPAIGFTYDPWLDSVPRHAGPTA